MIKKNEPKVSLGRPFYDHLDCNKKRVESIKEKHGIDVDYTDGQQKLI